ncbi:MAG: hypothetical protein BRD46_01475 [Bacteroidetes bacterium QS_8_68_15]|nr:MAG: hypothetical protein BRD46_01475 [Bacteroidetes bacterium QS_8_68_15]
MKTRSTNVLSAALASFALLGGVALAGCTGADLTGPSTAPPETQQVDDAGPQTQAQDTEGGGGTGTTGEHNVMPEDDE